MLASVTSLVMGLGVFTIRAASQRQTLAPIRLSSSERRLILFVGDSLAVATCLFMPISLGIAVSSATPSARFISFALLLTLWTISAAVFDCNDSRVTARATHTFGAVTRAVIVTTLAYFAVQLALTSLIPAVGRNVGSLAASSALALLAIYAGRIAYIMLLARTTARRRIAFVGTPASWRAASDLLKAIEIEYEVAGLVTRDDGGNSSEGIRFLGPHAELGRIVREHQIDEVIVADEGEDPSTMDALIAPYESGVIVRHLSDVFEEVSGRIPVRYLRPHWFAMLPRRPGCGRAYDVMRRSIDVVVAGTALVVVAPFLAAIAVAIRLDSRGSAIFRQEREGYRGRCFTMLKFRTMRTDAEASGPVWASAGDPRRTRMGKLLRPTRLDELPQLWNVLVGDMSIIGPRPERPCFVTQLGQTIPFYRARTLVRPGITGWAQVRFAYAGSTEDSLEKLQWDLYYVKHRSPFLDLVIALKTVGVLLHASGR